MHPTDPAAGRHGADEAEESRTNPRRPEAREHHAGRSPEAAVQSEGHRFWLCQSCVQSCVLHLSAVTVLQVSVLHSLVFVSSQNASL